MKRKPAKFVLHYFDKIQNVVSVSTSDHCDHGWQVFIGRNPHAGLRHRYSVLKINCQTGKISNYACEVNLALALTIQKDIVRELVEARGGTDPFLITGWGTQVVFNTR